MLKKAFKAAWPKTIPIMAGFLFLGFSYGVYMNVSGFSFVYPMVMSAVIYGGSLEFLTVSMLLSPFAPLQVFTVSLMIQARHLFYGISMLEKFKGTGLKKFYLIYGMCDETFSVNYVADISADVDRGWFMFFVTLLNQIYWVAGATLGGLFGSLITFNTKGLDFVMTALFAVIFLDRLMTEKKHYTAAIGVLSALACRIIFGADSFMLPTMGLMLLLLTAFKKPLERSGGLE